jgi:hypothetical protein
MRIHRAIAVLQILSGLLFVGAAHAQDPEPAASAADSSEIESLPEAPLRGRQALAALAVALEPVTLAPNAKVDPALEADCKFEEIVGIDVAKRLKHARLGGGKPKGSDPRLLRLAVTDVSGESGGIYSGTKSIRIHATLLIDGKVDRETDIYRYNVGGNPFRGTCHLFRQHTKRLGKDLVSWIKDKNYRVDDHPMGDKDEAD